MRDLNSIHISQETRRKIAGYYRELYQKYETQSITEICKELNISKFTIECFLRDYCPREEYELTKMGLMILLSTKFGSTSPYRKIQKNYLEEMEKRAKIRKIKELTKQYNAKRLSLKK